MNSLKKPNQFLTKLTFTYDITTLQSLLGRVCWDEKNRCELNRPTGHWLYDPYEIRDEWKNTEFENFLKAIPYSIGEARLMKLLPGNCYCAHADIDDRLHMNLTSNDQSYLIDLTNDKMHLLRPDSSLYYMDGGKLHTATNFGSTERIQLVIRLLLKKYTGLGFVTKTIEFHDPVFNLRYLLDNHVSSFINEKIKNGCIGYFNPLSETKIEFHLKETTLHELLNRIKAVHNRITIND